MRFRTTLLCSTLVLALASPARAGIRYVNAALSTGANNGTSWADAYQGTLGLQAAISYAVAGDQIWVAQGSYKPAPVGGRAVHFELRTGIEIYGGFAGGETSLSQRDFVAHVTILTGDLSGNDGSGQFDDNSLHVLHSLNAASSAILDGFTVRGGNANDSSTGLNGSGGGFLCEGGTGPTLRNCILAQNRCITGGAAVSLSSASPNFVDCRFESNSAATYAGAIYAFGGHPAFLRCIFSGNTALRGSALLFQFGTGSPASLTNCLFWNNTATGTIGGAIYVTSGSPVIRHCIVAGNHSLTDPVAGIYASPSVNFVNDLVYFNEGPGGAQGLLNNVGAGTCSWCCVQGISPGNGNISADPLFVNLAAGDLHLALTSPCADAGNNFYVPNGTTTDLDGNPRLVDDPAVPDTGVGSGPIVDIGAYELQNTLYTRFCAGDGSLATACPCGNTGAAGRGCLNSEFFSNGALLVASGAVSPDTIGLTASDMLPTASCVFLQGNLQDPAGVVFGDGVRCVAGSLKRLYVKSATLGEASAPGPGNLSISARSAQLGDPIAAGTQRYYQVYYRDAVLGFCSAPQGDSWNVSSGMIVNW